MIVLTAGYDDEKSRDDTAFAAELPYTLDDVWNWSFFVEFLFSGIYLGSRAWTLILGGVTSIEVDMFEAAAAVGPPSTSNWETRVEGIFGAFIGPIVESAIMSAKVDGGVVAGDAVSTGGGREAWTGWHIFVTTGGCFLEFYGGGGGLVALSLGNAGWTPFATERGDEGSPRWSRAGWRIEAPDGWSSGTVHLDYDWQGIWDEYATYPKDAVVRQWTHYYRSLVAGNTHDPAPIEVAPDLTSGTCRNFVQTPESKLYWESFTPLEVPEPTITTFVDDCAVDIIGASEARFVAGTPGFPIARDTFSVGYHNNLYAGDTQPKDPLNGGIGEVAIWSGPRALGIDRRIGLRFPPP